MTTKAFKVLQDGFILGRHYAKNDEIFLTEAQAKYLTAPYGDDVAPKKEPEAAKPKDK